MENRKNIDSKNDYNISLKIINADIERAKTLINDPEYQFRKVTENQALYMSELSGIELQPEEIRLYCALREQASPRKPKADEKEIKSAEVGSESSAWQLSDQEILAVVLEQEGDTERLEKFVKHYPNIFYKYIKR